MAYNKAPKRHWNHWNFFICWLVSLGQVAFGYPASIIGTTLGEPSFLIYMGLLDVTKTPPQLSSNANELIGATSGVFQAGAAINVILAGYVADRWGRKAGVLYCALLSVFGGALLVGSVNINMFVSSTNNASRG